MSNDERVTEGLKKISKKIEDMNVGTPDLIAMVNFVSDEQARIATRNNKQLAIFSCTALSILAALILIYQLSTMAFVITQGLFFVVPAVLLLMKWGRRNELT